MRLFIGYRLKGDDEARVDALRRDLALKHSVQAALKIPPHFTLHYPFESADVSAIERSLAEFASAQAAFGIELKGFDCFEPDVWFIDVGHEPRLQSIRDALKSDLAALGIQEEKRFPDPFHFHVTLAYKDLSPQAFSAIGRELAGHPLPIGTLNIDSISLFGKVDDAWSALRDFPFTRG